MFFLLLQEKKRVFHFQNQPIGNEHFKKRFLEIPFPIFNLVKTPQQSSLFLHFFKIFQSSKSCMIGIRFPEICFETLINLELCSQIYIKIKELDYLLKN